MPKWTDEQMEAITKADQSIIVSAGAGSGKTAVLTQRVIEKLKQGTKVNELLILTFTNASATEMKDRIKDAISKDESLNYQLDLLDSAYITTFDSFTLSIVKKYHYLLNIKQDIAIADEIMLSIKKKHFLTEVLNDMYDKPSQQFTNFINNFCLKDDEELKKLILNVMKNINLRIDKETYLKDYCNNYYSQAFLEQTLKEYLNMIRRKISDLQQWVTELKLYADSKYLDKLYPLLDNLFKATTYQEIKFSSNIKLPSLPRGSSLETKEIKKTINDIVKQIQQLCIYKDEDVIIGNILATKENSHIIVEVLTKLDQKIIKFKHESDLYDFTDIAFMAISIIVNNPLIKDNLKSTFQEIMIDEYQDTSDIQEYMINLISDNNVYMVGDIKQSIYRFRNANPYIFKQKYSDYSQNRGGYKIDLTKNFRTRGESINDINKIFNKLMSDTFGDASYEVSHQLIFGNNAYLEGGKNTHDHKLEIYNYARDKNYSYPEIEAFIIANDINQKLATDYQVMDKKTNTLRKANYSDFAILLDRSKNFDLYKKIFTYLNIPLNIYKDQSITKEYDILVIKNIINIIVNVLNKDYHQEFVYNFVSISRIFLIATPDEEIFNAIKNKKIFETSLFHLIKEICVQVPHLSLQEIMYLIIEKFNIYKYIPTIGNTAEILVHLEYLINLAGNLDQNNYSIFDMSVYLKDVMEEALDIKIKTSKTNMNAVKIMTIHTSKGLEYPICYYSGLTDKFNIKDLNDNILYNNKFGIIIPYYDQVLNPTILKTLCKEKYLQEEISEKIRLFYVALTRSREKIIIVTPLKENSATLNEMQKIYYRSFNDFLSSLSCYLQDNIINLDLLSIPLTKDYNLIKKSNYEQSIAKSIKKIQHQELNIITNLQGKSSYSKKINKPIDLATKSNLALGIKLHYELELLDFQNPNFDHLDSLSQTKIKAFLNLDIMSDIKNAILYKEYEFSYLDNNESKTGIIDLIIEYPTKMYIIDYKLQNIIDDNYKKQLTGYKEYLKTKTTKPIKTYLYSLMEEKLIEVK